MSTVVRVSSTVFTPLQNHTQPLRLHSVFILPSFASFSQLAVNTRGKPGERPRQRLCGLALRSSHHYRISLNQGGCVACLFSRLLLVLANSQLTYVDKLVNDHVNGCAELYVSSKPVYFKMTRPLTGERPCQRLCGLALQSLHRYRITLDYGGCTGCLFSMMMMMMMMMS